MAFIFGGTTSCVKKGNNVRDYQTELRHTSRSMEREEAKSMTTEKQLQASIQKNASERNFALCNLKAKELIRLRGHRNRLVTMRGYMATLGQQLSTVQSAQAMGDIVEKTSKLLTSMNGKRDLAHMGKVLRDFERQNSLMQAKQEVVEDTLDSIFETEGEQENIDDAVGQVFTELGLDSAIALSGAGVQNHKHCALAEAADPQSDQSMEARLARLKSRP